MRVVQRPNGVAELVYRSPSCCCSKPSRTETRKTGGGYLLGCPVLIEWKGMFRKRKRNFLKVWSGACRLLTRQQHGRDPPRHLGSEGARQTLYSDASSKFSAPKGEVRQNAETTASMAHNQRCHERQQQPFLQQRQPQRHLGRAAAAGSSLPESLPPWSCNRTEVVRPSSSSTV